MVILYEARVSVSDHAAFFDQLSSIGQETDCLIQAVDARYIAGPTHVETAVTHARRAIATGIQIAEDPAIELLLYLAATRQIDTAVTIGVPADTQTDAVIVIDGADEATARERVAALSAVTPTTVDVGDATTVQSWFGITSTEQAVTDASLELLVSERVALLAVEA